MSPSNLTTVAAVRALVRDAIGQHDPGAVRTMLRRGDAAAASHYAPTVEQVAARMTVTPRRARTLLDRVCLAGDVHRVVASRGGPERWWPVDQAHDLLRAMRRPTGA